MAVDTVDEVAIKVSVLNDMKAGIDAAQTTLTTQMEAMRGKLDEVAKSSAQMGETTKRGMAGAATAASLLTRQFGMASGAAGQSIATVATLSTIAMSGGPLALGLGALAIVIQQISSLLGEAAAKAEAFNAANFDAVKAALTEIDGLVATASKARLDLLGGKGTGDLEAAKAGIDKAKQAMLNFGETNTKIYETMHSLTQQEQADMLKSADAMFGRSSAIYKNTERYIGMERNLADAQTNYLKAQDLVRGNNNIEASKKLGDEQAGLIKAGMAKTLQDQQRYAIESQRISQEAMRAGVAEEERIKLDYQAAMRLADSADQVRRENLTHIYEAKISQIREAEAKSLSAKIYQVRLQVLGDEERINAEYNKAILEDDAKNSELRIALVEARDAKLRELAIKRRKEVAQEEAARKTADDRLIAEQRRVLAQMEQNVRATMAPIKAAMDTLLEGMLRGQMSFSDAMNAMWASLARMIITKIWEMVTAQIAAALVETTAKQTAATATVAANAAAAGSETAKQTAQIPFVGPVIAVAAGLAMMGAIIAAMKIKSASGGYDIPSTVGSHILEVHRDEMVLPAHIANPLRKQLADGSGGGGVIINVSAIDGASVQRMVESPTFRKSIREATSNGRL